MITLKNTRYVLSLSITAAVVSSCGQLQSAELAPPFSGIPFSDWTTSSAHDRDTELFVAGGDDTSDSAVTVFSVPSYRQIRKITEGILAPVGLWMDKPGNLYVANSFSHSGAITEYAPGKSRPRCSYNLRSTEVAVAVTTDDDHRVYAAGNDVRQYNRTGYLYAFEECGKLLKRTRIGTLQINFARGVAVDAAGDVFVAFFGGGNRGRFVEFVGGGSTPTYLGAVIGGGSGSTGSGTGGLIIDKNGTLIATDTFNTIYTIPPPYSTANVLATGLSFPWTLSLNKPETLLYSANAGSGTVTAFKYPSGKRVKTLNTFPAIGVAAGPDATF